MWTGSSSIRDPPVIPCFLLGKYLGLKSHYTVCRKIVVTLASMTLYWIRELGSSTRRTLHHILLNLTWYWYEVYFVPTPSARQKIGRPHLGTFSSFLLMHRLIISEQWGVSRTQAHVKKPKISICWAFGYRQPSWSFNRVRLSNIYPPGATHTEESF